MEGIKKHIEKFFFYNIDVVLMYAAVSLVFLHKITAFHIDIQIACFIFIANIFGVLGIYLLNKITDKEEDRLNGHQTITLNNRKIYRVLLLLFIGATCLYFATGKEYITFYGLLLFILGSAYSFPKKYRLKNIFLIKNIVPAFCWYFSLSVFIFACTKNLPILYIMQLMIPLFVLEFIFEIIWDLPDKDGDKLAHIQTLPAVLGFVYTQTILAILICLYFFYTNSIQNKLFCLCIFIFLLFIKKETRKYIYHYFLFILTITVAFAYFIQFV